MKNKGWLLLLLPVLLPLFGVSWPRGQEIDRFQSADVLAADRQGGALLLTLTVRGDAEAEAAVFSGRGATVDEALARLSAASPKEPLYAQTRFLLLGDSVPPEEAGTLGRDLLELMDLRLGTGVYAVEGQAASLAEPGLGDTLEESRLRLEATSASISTLGSLLRQSAAGETPALTRLRPEG